MEVSTIFIFAHTAFYFVWQMYATQARVIYRDVHTYTCADDVVWYDAIDMHHLLGYNGNHLIYLTGALMMKRRHAVITSIKMV